MTNKNKALLILTTLIASTTFNANAQETKKNEPLTLEEIKEITAPRYNNKMMRVPKKNGIDVLDTELVPNLDGDISMGSVIGDKNTDITPLVTEDGEGITMLVYDREQFTPNAKHSFIGKDDNKSYIITILGEVTHPILLVTDVPVMGDLTNVEIVKPEDKKPAPSMKL